MKIFDRQMLIGFLLGALIGLGAAAPTNEDTEAIEERGALEPRGSPSTIPLLLLVFTKQKS